MKQTKKSLEAECRQIIKHIGLCNSIKDEYPLEYNFLKEILSWHHSNRADGMTDLQTRNNEFGRIQLFVVKNLKTNQDGISLSFIESIGWKDCVNRKINGITEYSEDCPFQDTHN